MAADPVTGLVLLTVAEIRRLLADLINHPDRLTPRTPSHGKWAGVLMITAAWTGARWGELVSLQRHNTHLDEGCLVIDPDIGALHEVNGKLSLGPPKTDDSARTISLPPFLIDLLRAHLASCDHPHVFVTAEGELLRRRNVARRATRPAADGTPPDKRTRVPLQPIRPGGRSTDSGTATNLDDRRRHPDGGSTTW